jgi:hypothetical protein
MLDSQITIHLDGVAVMLITPFEKGVLNVNVLVFVSFALAASALSDVCLRY